MKKPLVTYSRLLRCEEGGPALVFPVDHPGAYVSNTTMVVTSTVLRFDRRSGEFETMNTLYRPAEGAEWHALKPH